MMGGITILWDTVETWGKIMGKLEIWGNEMKRAIQRRRTWRLDEANVVRLDEAAIHDIPT